MRADTTMELEGATDAQTERPRWRRSSSVSFVLLAVAAGAYCAWVLSLPAFPSQDGPMHLYFTRIMQALLFHRDPGLFPQYFTIKHVLPPYALYYYLLLAFGHFVPLVMADKLAICVYILLFVFGFRFLARSLGPSGDAVSLLATAFVLNWQLGMGFVNFCLSIALGLWALGLWCRVAARPQASGNGLRLSGFVALCCAMLLTHPVPLAAVLGFCFIELCVRLWRSHRAGEPLFSALFRRDGIAFVLAGTTMFYVKAFANSNLTKQYDPQHKTYLQAIRFVFRGLALLGTTDYLSPHSPLSALRRVSLFVIVAVALVLGAAHLWRSIRRRSWELADTWFLVAVTLGGAVPLMPPDFNGAHLFSARLMIFPVLGALLAAAGARALATARGLACCAAASALLLAVTLRQVIHDVNPIARQMGAVENGQQPIERGIYLGLITGDYLFPFRTLTFDPYLWGGLRVVRETDSILYSVPWLQQSHIPVGAQPVLPVTRLDQNTLELMSVLRERMLQSSAFRAMMFAPVNSVVLNSGTSLPQSGLDPLLQLDPVLSHRWVCKQEEFLAVCHLDARP